MSCDSFCGVGCAVRRVKCALRSVLYLACTKYLPLSTEAPPGQPITFLQKSGQVFRCTRILFCVALDTFFFRVKRKRWKENSCMDLCCPGGASLLYGRYYFVETCVIRTHPTSHNDSQLTALVAKPANTARCTACTVYPQRLEREAAQPNTANNKHFNPCTTLDRLNNASPLLRMYVLSCVISTQLTVVCIYNVVHQYVRPGYLTVKETRVVRSCTWSAALQCTLYDITHELL